MSEEKPFQEIEADIVKALKNVYDPEIPVNVYDLGLIYEIDVKSEQEVDITMTLTAPNCPMADLLLNDVETYVKDVKGIDENAKMKETALGEIPEHWEIYKDMVTICSGSNLHQYLPGTQPAVIIPVVPGKTVPSHEDRLV